MSRKTIFVTGASRGIGAATLRLFSDRGWRTIGCARTAKENWEFQPDLAIEAEIDSADQVRSVVQRLADFTKSLNVLINNAGVALHEEWDPSSSERNWIETMNINLNAPYRFTKFLLPYIPNDGSGRIVNVSSILGLKAVADASAYCASKHALIGLTKSLALKVANRRITVNAICPGWVRTKMATDRMADIGMSLDAANSSTPLGKICEPADIAKLAYFLSSEESSNITGQSLVVDGGSTL